MSWAFMFHVLLILLFGKERWLMVIFFSLQVLEFLGVKSYEANGSLAYFLCKQYL